MGNAERQPLAIAKLLRDDIDGIVDSWRELCRWDPMLPPQSNPPIAAALVSALADALEHDRQAPARRHRRHRRLLAGALPVGPHAATAEQPSHRRRPGLGPGRRPRARSPSSCATTSTASSTPGGSSAGGTPCCHRRATLPSPPPWSRPWPTPSSTIAKLLRDDIDGIVDSWRELCRWDPMLPPQSNPPIAAALVSALADALEHDRQAPARRHRRHRRLLAGALPVGPHAATAEQPSHRRRPGLGPGRRPRA